MASDTHAVGAAPAVNRPDRSMAVHPHGMEPQAVIAVTGRTEDVAAPKTHHPIVNRLAAERAASIQLRLADRITAFAGSMPFVYCHVLLFGVWMLMFERSPWPTLTLAVSLEAIFLSCFVMIGQNRQAAFQQAKADHEFVVGEQELKLNTELTREIHELTREVHERVVLEPSTGSAARAPMD
jgi:uncharacterized membrane protein